MGYIERATSPPRPELHRTEGPAYHRGPVVLAFRHALDVHVPRGQD